MKCWLSVKRPLSSESLFNGAFRDEFRGFREDGNLTCESFVGLDVGNSVRDPDSVSLFDRGFRLEVHEAKRGGHDWQAIREDVDRSFDGT